MRNLLVPLLLLGLSACVSPLRYAWQDYREGMRELKSDPVAAHEAFAEADGHLVEALDEPHQTLPRRVTALSLRVRVLIELDRHDEARALAGTTTEGYDPNHAYEGDLVGLSLIRARNLDAERAYAELVLAGRLAHTIRSRLHVTWEAVHTLQRLGTPMAKGEAVKLCDQNAGKLDFDQLKKSLQ